MKFLGHYPSVGWHPQFGELGRTIVAKVSELRAWDNARIKDQRVMKRDPHPTGVCGELIVYYGFGMFPKNLFFRGVKSAARGEDRFGDIVVEHPFGDVAIDVKARDEEKDWRDLIVKRTKKDVPHPHAYANTKPDPGLGGGEFLGFYPADLLFDEKWFDPKLPDPAFRVPAGELMEWEELVRYLYPDKT